MKKNTKILLGIIGSTVATIPFVAADLKAGPEVIVLPILALAIVGGFIVGAIFLIRWIIKKIKNKQQ